MKVAIQGQDGSFHAQVARRWYGDDVTLIECVSFPDVFEAYERGEADAIISAVENTVYGSINQVYGLVEACDAPIIGEVKLPITQHLIGLTGTDLASVQTIYSHPVALAQCRTTLEKLMPQAELVEYFDTAGAVELVKDSADATMVAVAGESAAKLYNLPILHNNVNDSEHNITRFLVLSKHDAPNPEDCNRTSMVITTSHQPGALVEVLQVFAAAGVNLAKLQSQPIVGEPWKYKFFIVADAAGGVLRDIVDDISHSGHNVRILGEYSSC